MENERAIGDGHNDGKEISRICLIQDVRDKTSGISDTNPWFLRLQQRMYNTIPDLPHVYMKQAVGEPSRQLRQNVLVTYLPTLIIIYISIHTCIQIIYKPIYL